MKLTIGLVIVCVVLIATVVWGAAFLHALLDFQFR